MQLSDQMVTGITVVILSTVVVAGLVTRQSRATCSDAASGHVRKPLWRRLVGVLAAAPFPVAGYAFPLSAPVALVAAFLPASTVQSRTHRALTVAAGGGSVALCAGALLQGVDLPRLALLSFLAFLIFFVAASRTTSSEGDAAQLLAWASAATTVFYLFFGNERTDRSFAYLWKYGIGMVVGFVIVYILVLARRSWLTIALVLALGTFSIVIGYRSHGLVCFTAAVTMTCMKGARGSRSRRVRLAVMVVMIAVLAQVLPRLIDLGVFGRTIRLRTVVQESGSASALLAGRVEPPLSIAAIIAKPIFGWGNVNALDQATLTQGSRIASLLGLPSPSMYINVWRGNDGNISLHSVVLGAWAEGGIIAAALPLALLVLFVLAVIRAQGQFAPFVVLVSIQMIWDLCFSPWVFNRPLIFAAAAALACHTISCGTDREVERTRPRGLPHARMSDQPQTSGSSWSIPGLTCGFFCDTPSESRSIRDAGR